MRLMLAVFFSTLSAMASGATQPGVAQASTEARVIIFFAWDRPVIDGDAAAQLDRVAEAYRAMPDGQLIVAGHADRSGPDGANVRSGRVRAEVVAAHLAEKGIPAAAMRIVSHGETRPLIATQDGVREPQNRRVEIMRASNP